MSLDRRIWKFPFTLPELPPWPCPNCKAGVLRIAQDTWHKKESVLSKNARSDQNWEPSWVNGRFCTILECNYCHEIVSLAGHYANEEMGDGEGSYTTPEVYYPVSLTWSPEIIPIPDSIPEKFASELRKSFALYYCDAQSCANRIRSSIETLLTHLGVKKTTVNKKGKRVRLPLHDRIVSVRNSNRPLADFLLALKWLGNAGSHSSKLNQEDLLDAYEILEQVIDQVFVRQAKKVAKLSKQINRRRKPRSVRRL